VAGEPHFYTERLRKVLYNRRMERDWKKAAFWALRLGLSVTYFYSGTDLLLHPSAWVPYMPFWFKSLLPIDPLLYLQIQGVVEVLFALSFLTGLFLRPVTLLAAFEMVSILLFYGVDGVSFRDLGLLGAAAALFFLTFETRRDANITKT